MKLVTPHFSQEEFQRYAHPEKGFPTAKQYPPEWVSTRLKPLCQALEILRAELGGKPIKISSGYRDAMYNSAIGGAKNSQHMKGKAADIIVAGVSAQVVHDAVLALRKAGKIPQVGGLGRYPGFTHVDVRPSTMLIQWDGAGTDP